MTYASCTICGSDLRPSYARTCPECSESVCDDCGDQYQGYCQACFDEL